MTLFLCLYDTVSLEVCLQLLAAVFTNRKEYRFLPFGDQISSTESMSIRKWVDNSGTADRVSFI